MLAHSLASVSLISPAATCAASSLCSSRIIRAMVSSSMRCSVVALLMLIRTTDRGAPGARARKSLAETARHKTARARLLLAEAGLDVCAPRRSAGELSIVDLRSVQRRPMCDARLAVPNRRLEPAAPRGVESLIVARRRHRFVPTEIVRFDRVGCCVAHAHQNDRSRRPWSELAKSLAGTARHKTTRARLLLAEAGLDVCAAAQGASICARVVSGVHRETLERLDSLENEIRADLVGRRRRRYRAAVPSLGAVRVAIEVHQACDA